MGADADGRPELLPQLRLDELLAELQRQAAGGAAARDQMRGLLEAVIAISSGLDLESTLRRIVETAVRLVDATYGALGVIGDGDEGGKRLAEFIPVGLQRGGDRADRPLARRARPAGLARQGSAAAAAGRHGSTHPNRPGSPTGIRRWRSFLGVPVRVRDEVFGNLYLTNKRGGGEFTEDDEAVLLSRSAPRRASRWRTRGCTRPPGAASAGSQASAEVTTALLSGTDPDEVLASITSQARELSDADLAVLALPDEDGRA